MESGLVCYYQVYDGKEASKFHQIAVLELHGPTYSLYLGGTGQTRKVQGCMTISYSDHCHVGMYFKVGHLFYPIEQHATRDAFHFGGVDFYSSFPTRRHEDGAIKGEW
jgi:hypothetical protein